MIPIELSEVRIEITPRLPYRLRATRHGNRFQAAETPVTVIIGEQKLATPDRAVLAQAKPIKNDAKHRRSVQRKFILGQTRGDVCVVMLDLEHSERMPLSFHASQLR